MAACVSPGMNLIRSALLSVAVFLAFAAASSAATLAENPIAMLSADDPCAVPLAIPDDDRDDRVAIQNALTTRRCAHLTPGVYDIASIPFTPPLRRPYQMLEANSAQLFGDGPGTVLKFSGANGGQDWEGIRITGVGSTLHDMSIDTRDLRGTVEQTAAVKLFDPERNLPVTNVEISHVSFDHPIHLGEKSGDCIQLVGFNDGREIEHVQIHDNDFVHCDRSGVAVHSGTSDLVIRDNRFRDIGNTDLDFEGSGGTTDVLIERNTMKMSPGPHGTGSMQLQLVNRVHVVNNVFDGRGMDLYQVRNVDIDDNTITLRQDTTVPVISVGKDSVHNRIHDNVITRESTAGANALISAGPHGSGTPEDLAIEDNVLTQRTSYHVVNALGLRGLYVRRNTISYSGDATQVADRMWGVRAIGTSGAFAVRTTDVHVDGNTFAGALRGAFATSGSFAGAGGEIHTSDNVATGGRFGIFCDNFARQEEPIFIGGVTGPFTSARDRWPTPRCGPENFVTVIPPADEIPPPPPDEDPPVIEDDEPPVISPHDDPPVDPVLPVDVPPGTGAGGGTPPVLDTTAPVLSGVSLSRIPFRVAKAPTAITAGARRGTVLRFSSSEAGTLSIQIERVQPGHKVNKGAKQVCKAVPPAVKRGRCNLYSRAATLTGAIKAGPGRVALTGRIGAKRMKPGSYRLTLTASDAAGNRSKAVVRTIKVLAG